MRSRAHSHEMVWLVAFILCTLLCLGLGIKIGYDWRGTHPNGVCGGINEDIG